MTRSGLKSSGRGRMVERAKERESHSKQSTSSAGRNSDAIEQRDAEVRSA